MDYCAGVWDCKQYDQYNTVHNRAIRSYLGVHRYASNMAINGHVDWTTPHTRRKICMIKLWNRLVKMPDTRLTKRLLCWVLIAIGQKHCVEITNIFLQT